MNFSNYKSAVFLFALLIITFSVKGQQLNFNNCKRCVVLAEQSVNRVAILNLDTKTIVWEWQPKGVIKPEHLPWYKYPSDAKAVYNGQYILTTASGGAVTLIRIADKKVMFYAYAGGNTHSAEVLPDGNIVSASSNGNYLTVFHTDTLHFPDNIYKKNIWLPFGHNVVWDKKQQVLWSASQNKLKSFTYNFNRDKPDLAPKDSIPLPGTQAHDLFPAYNEQALWLTNTTDMYKYSFKTNKLEHISVPYHDVKSVSSGPVGYPTLLIYSEDIKKGWWTDEIVSIGNGCIFKMTGLKIYKARWYIDNKFSY
jgi:hypothetical protein